MYVDVVIRRKNVNVNLEETVLETMGRIEACALRHGYDFALALEVVVAKCDGFHVPTEDKDFCKSSRLIDSRQMPVANQSFGEPKPFRFVPSVFLA